MTTYYDSHFDAFLAFAKKQPEGRLIDHSSGWCGCAVGDFYREATSIPPVGEDMPEIFSDCALLQELERDHPYIAESLNYGYVLGQEENYERTSGHEIDTYRGLARFMDAFRGEVAEEGMLCALGICDHDDHDDRY